MSTVKWTKSQEKAITSRDSGIIVSAAAGSGKTTVLIERLTRLLLDENNKIPSQNLLAVTFTNKAAAQMREKLNAAVDKELEKCFLSPELRDSDRCKWLLEQKNNLQFSKVSTINSFCLEFIKNNISSFEFQSGLKILDEATELMLFENSKRIAIEELCQNSVEQYSLLCNAFDIYSGKLDNMIRELYVFLRTIPFREQWINNVKKPYQDEEYINQAINEYRKIIDGKLGIIRNLLDDLDVLFDRLKGFEQISSFNKSVESAYNVLSEQCNDLSECLKTNDTERFIMLLEPKVRKPSLRNNKLLEAMELGERALLTDMCNQASSIIAEINETLKTIKADGVLSDKRIKDNLAEIAAVFDILINIVTRTEELMYDAKLERNAVDFSDVELMTKDLLVELKDGEIVRTPLCEDIRSSGVYRIITIDEFQDVNNLQELIFRALSNGKDLSHMGDNVFVVGDIKQAIYRFRQTNPELFNKSVSDACKGYDDLFLINLQENFRSREGIIDFVNSVFSVIMTEKMGGVDYDETQMLRFGARYYPCLESNCDSSCVELLLANRHDDFFTKDFNEEFFLIAKKIKSILKSDSQYLVMDEKTKEMRPCRPSDICVLLQTNNGVSKMAKALEYVGLKTSSQNTEGYLKSSEITLILSILRVIDNPLNDIAMTSMLMSSVFGFTATDMLLIQSARTKNDGKTINGIYTVLSNAHLSYTDKEAHDFEYERLFDDNKELQKKCSDVYLIIESFVYRSMSSGLEKLIRYIYDSTELLAAASTYLDSDKKRANLLLFLQYAKEYEESGGDGISGFLRFIDSVYSNDKAFKQSGKITASGEAVSVMTFHASKGLEFPYVFLCDLVHKSNSGRENIFMHYKVTDSQYDRDEISFETSDTLNYMIKTNINHSKMKEQSMLDDKSERLRLLYVGCTRAREKLFLSVSPECNGLIKVKTGMNNIKSLLINADKCKERDAMESLVMNGDNMLYWLLCGISHFYLGKEFFNWLVGEYDPYDDKTINEVSKLEDAICNHKKTKPNFVIKLLDDEIEVQDEILTQDIADADSVLVAKLKNVYKSEKEYNDVVLNKALLPSKLTVTEIVRDEKEAETLKQNERKDEYGDDIDFNPEFFPSLPKLDDSHSKLTSAERGTFTHKFMELASYQSAEISVKNELDRLVDKGYFTELEASGVYVNRLEAFFSSDFYKRMKASDELIREKKFLVAMRDISLSDKHKGLMNSDGMLQGIADCIFKECDGYVIVDYKTDNFKSIDDMDKYSTQLELYKAALEIVLGENINGSIKKAVIKSCYIYSFKLGIGKEFRF